MIIGLSGQAGVGKDTVADVLVARCGFAKVSLADPMKRFCEQVYGFTRDELWGPSPMRNRPRVDIGGLTARRALQTLGTEWGRACFENTWIAIALRTASTLLRPALEGDAPWLYSPSMGSYLGPEFGPPVRGVVIPDIRFANECEAIKAAGGKVIRITRPVPGLEGAAAQHASELEQQGMSDDAFDGVIQNEGSLESLRTRALLWADVLPQQISRLHP